jgi:hypothetical protein
MNWLEVKSDGDRCDSSDEIWRENTNHLDPTAREEFLNEKLSLYSD